MRAGRKRSGARHGARAVALVVAAACAALAAPVALGAPSKTVVVADARGDVSGALDITRVSLQRSSDGRLRATVSFADKLTPKSLLADSGPPGSACLRIWTRTAADPASTRPDRLVCVTSRIEEEYRVVVYDNAGRALPKRIGDASVTTTASGKSLVIRFTQTTLGRPARIRFAAESTRPGCDRTSCVDHAPEPGATRLFRLR